MKLLPFLFFSLQPPNPTPPPPPTIQRKQPHFGCAGDNCERRKKVFASLPLFYPPLLFCLVARYIKVIEKFEEVEKGGGEKEEEKEDSRKLFLSPSSWLLVTSDGLILGGPPFFPYSPRVHAAFMI